MRSYHRLSLRAGSFVVSLFLLRTIVWAQTPVTVTPDDQMGIMPYASYHGGNIDNVSLATGNLVVNAPLLSYSQRGGALKVQFDVLYNGHPYQVHQFCVTINGSQSCTTNWVSSGFSPNWAGALPSPAIGVNVIDSDHITVAQNSVPVVVCSTCDPIHYIYQELFKVMTEDNASHLLGLVSGTGGSCGTSAGQYPYIWNSIWGTFESLDATGWQVTIAQPNQANCGFTGTTINSIISPNGVQHLNSDTVRQDSNGNQVTINTTTNIMTDTLGRQIPLPPTASTSSNASTSLCPTGALTPISAVYWAPPGYNGSSQEYLFCYASVLVNINPTQPPYPTGEGSGPVSVTMLQSITLPNGTSWLFAYNDTDGTTWEGSPTNYGSLTQITLPTGGTISYTYVTLWTPTDLGSRWVASRTVNANDGTGPHTWNYSYGSSTQQGNGPPTVVTDPLLNDSTHTFQQFGPNGTPYDISSQYYQGSHTAGTLLKTVATTYQAASGGLNIENMYPMVPVNTTTTWPNSQTTKTTSTYDPGFSYVSDWGSTGNSAIYGKIINNTVYDYPSATSVLRASNTSYQAFGGTNSSYYLANNLLDLPCLVTVYGPGSVPAQPNCTPPTFQSNQVAQMTYGYDETSLQSTGVSLTGESYPGNQTSVHRWLNGSTTATTNCNVTVSNGYLVSKKVYYNTGEVQKSTDPCGYATTYQYGSSNTGALPTAVTNNVSQVTTYGYDSNNLVVTSIQDPNQQTTTKNYDILSRLISIAYPDGGSTTYCYTDGVPANCPSGDSGSYPFGVVVTKAITSSQNEITTAVVDGLGRLLQTQLNSDPSGTDYVDITYDGLGRKATSGNPHRSTSSSTDGTTSYVYDAIGRVCVVVQPDGTQVSQSSGCPSTAPVGDQFTNYASFPCTTGTDEAGNSRESCVDGLGRMTSVVEDPGSSPHLNYSTTYAYDALGNLLTVTQNGSNANTPRNRSFQYDSLSQLTRAQNPESGLITYAYDADGNVVSKAAPLPNQTTWSTVTTTYVYDTLNRLTSKSYAENGTADPYTPTVQFGYDGVALSGCAIAVPGDTDSYPIGRRTSICDGSGGTSWTHDKMGRILQERRTVGSVTGKYDMDAYNLDGSVASETALGYGIGYTYNTARQVTKVQNFSDPFNFVTSASYAPPGELVSASLGAAPITITNAYSERLQPILLSATNSSSTLFSECFNFHLGVAITTPSQCALAAYTTGDNGNVYTVANNRSSGRTQTFTYDALNRIFAALGGTTWGENYTIDAWGNLTNITAPHGLTGENLQASPASSQNQISGFCYDAAGNLVLNSTCPQTLSNPTYVYDAENRLIWTSGYRYIYDADGERVEKCQAASATTACATSGTTGTLYWKGTHADTQAETDLSGNVLENYIFFSGQRIARRDGSTKAVHFYFSDHLGTHGVVVNATGSTCEQDIDYYPYGGVESDYCSGSGVSQNYKFTGKERDSESGLDEFGARYYTSAFGRFMTPDWEAKPTDVPYASFGNPQSLNLYSYVNNNPTTTRDPDGHCPDGCPTPEQLAAQNQFTENVLVGAAKGLWNMVAGMWNTGANLLNAQTAASSPTGTPFGVPTVPMAQPANVTQAVSGAVAQTAVVVGTAVAESGAASRAAGESPGTAVPQEIPAGPSARPTAAQQSAINEMGEAHGCSTCGATTPGTKSGNWVGDHQPPTALNKDGGPQVYKPQCLQCSRQQGGQVAAAVRAAKKQDQPQQ
jgi:RHS repeat-associated protein